MTCKVECRWVRECILCFYLFSEYIGIGSSVWGETGKLGGDLSYRLWLRPSSVVVHMILGYYLTSLNLNLLMSMIRIIMLRKIMFFSHSILRCLQITRLMSYSDNPVSPHTFHVQITIFTEITQCIQFFAMSDFGIKIILLS